MHVVSLSNCLADDTETKTQNLTHALHTHSAHRAGHALHAARPRQRPRAGAAVGARRPQMNGGRGRGPRTITR
ncbi:TPA_asm: MC009.2R [Molluscum contagiosum virus]|nr:TPA_asm: MC009.2R [Molluscum contagiosum virus]DBA42095.1 TPA_asm: MC009.2R [Molluscum contagiosum virus]